LVRPAIIMFFRLFTGFDIVLDGRVGYNSIINGNWVQDGDHFKKGHCFMYRCGSRWLISKVLGTKENVYAYVDVKSGKKNRGPDRTNGWKVFNGKEFVVDNAVHVAGLSYVFFYFF